MTQELDTKRVCVLIRGDVELWIEANKRTHLQNVLADPTKRFIEINGQLVNTFEIVGVFEPTFIEEKTRRKNGQWRCEKGKWHDRGQSCECREYKEDVVAYVEGVGPIKYKR